MNEVLRAFTGLCLLRLIADMALPEGDQRQYVDLGMGLMTLLWMLRILISLLRGLP